MLKYYTRACNFYYGDHSTLMVNKKLALPLNGNDKISFDTIELITRKKKKRINCINKTQLFLLPKTLFIKGNFKVSTIGDQINFKA